MYAFFTNCLKVLSYQEFKTLFYQSLCHQVARSSGLLPTSEKVYEEALQKMSPDTDTILLKSSLKFDYDNFLCWLTDIAEGIKAPKFKEHLQKRTLSSFEKDGLAIGTAFAIFATAYAGTLLKKGADIINNDVFSFAKKDVLAAITSNYSPQDAVTNKPVLYLSMEYFYFEEDLKPLRCSHEKQRKKFLTEYFAALRTYQLVLPANALENAFKKFTL